MPPFAGSQVVYIIPGSDGDPSHRPSGNQYQKFDPPDIYLEKLGQLWMKERGEQKQGIEYKLDRLPAGYTVWGRPRKNNPQHIDKWCYGHPARKTFDSPNRFFPHFLHLMNNNGSSWGCPCTVCAAGSGKAVRQTATRKAAQTATVSQLAFFHEPEPVQVVQPPVAKFKGKVRQVETSTIRVDEEGTPDVYRNLIDKLRRHGSIDERIKETMSLDWRAERNLLPKMLDQFAKQPQWIPRLGELVLFVRRLGADEEICLDASTNEYKIWNPQLEEFTGHPRWEAGVVTQPAVEQPVIEDLVIETRKEFDISYSGFRVEPLPDPNSAIKHFSKQHKYIPLFQIRPFNFWGDFLHGMREDEWHPTIAHALIAMPSFSLLEKERFRGTWPFASITCRGIYLGAELLLVGDVVRLLPHKQDSVVTDVLKITSIELHLMNLDTASDDDYDQKHPYNSTVHVTGKAFTTDRGRAAGTTPKIKLPPILKGYDAQWYYLHDPRKSLKVPFNRVLGRCYEDEALILWFPSESASRGGIRQVADISQGLEGLQHAREYGSRNNGYIDDDKHWFWGDSRAESLDLATVNGYEVGSRDKSRDPKLWRRMIKIMEGNAAVEDRMALKKATLEARPLRQQKKNSFVRSGWRAINVEDEDDEAEQVPRTQTMAVDTDDEADQFTDEVAEGIGLPQSDEKAESSDDDVVMMDAPLTHRRIVVQID